MNLRTSIPLLAAMAVSIVGLSGCSRSTDSLKPWPPITTPGVFEDAFTGAVDFQAFGGSKLDAVSVDATEHYSGSASIKVTVPNPGDPTGTYAGGAFVASQARDLSGYDALVFWAKASRPVTLDVAGLGNDNTGTSKFDASWRTIPLTTAWKQCIIPIPDPSKLTSERGMFYFAGGAQSGAGYSLWFDQIGFQKTGVISNPRPVMTTQTLAPVVGTDASVLGTKVTFAVNGVDQVIEHMPGYLTYVSTNPAVARVSNGVVHVIGAGAATISAKLGDVPVIGTIALTASAPPAGPAPTPTVPAADVISLYSNAYTNLPVDTWSATWDVADVADTKLAGNDVKLYSNLVYAGIEFTTHPIDVTAMTAYHMDVWAPTGTTFKVKLVDFGADGAFGGGDDMEHELTFNSSSTPAFTTGTWVGLEVPLSDFTNLLTRAHLAQLIISGDTKTVYVDNVYFHK